MTRTLREQDILLHNSLEWFYKNVDTTDKEIARKARIHYDRIHKFLSDIAPVKPRRSHVAHEERRKLIYKMVADGAKPIQVARALGITRSSLNDWLKRQKMSPWRPKTEWTKEMDNKLISLYQEGNTPWAISKIMQLSDSVIRTRLRKLGIDLPAKSES